MTQQLQKLIKILQLQIAILKAQIELKLLQKKVTVPNLSEPRFVIVHHGGGDWDFNTVNNHHKQKWGFRSSLGYYLGYQKWIGYQEKVIRARRDTEEGAHTVDPSRPGFWNKNSVGICLRGDLTKNEMTEWQELMLAEELDRYKVAGYTIKAHRQIKATNCPGDHLWNWLRSNGYI